MLVREIMTTPVITVSPESTVRKAIRTLFQNGIAAAPVIDEDGRLVGIVSELDLLRDEFSPDPRAQARVTEAPTTCPPRYTHEIMSPNVQTLRENDDVLDSAALMLDTGA